MSVRGIPTGSVTLRVPGATEGFYWSVDVRGIRRTRQSLNFFGGPRAPEVLSRPRRLPSPAGFGGRTT
ncbi:hypothetical protein SFR_4851 [Streptomyces sp. FR-008]|nr:hypothetical protein SFR_4851 [Streptomyces sp. FR-008]